MMKLKKATSILFFFFLFQSFGFADTGFGVSPVGVLSSLNNQNDWAVRIKVIEKGAHLVNAVELWGYKRFDNYNGHGIVHVKKRKAVDNNGIVVFSREDLNGIFDLDLNNGEYIAKNEKNGFIDLYLFSGMEDNAQLVGKIGFKYLKKDYDVGRQKEAIVILHNDLVSYQEHPIELCGNDNGNKEWWFPQYYYYNYDLRILLPGYKKIQQNLFQTTMLIPPVNEQGSYLISNIEANHLPAIFVHGVSGTDNYWGANENLNDKDYPFTSYPGRFRALNDNREKYDVWEYYYPPDQAWNESGYLFGQDIKEIIQRYQTDKAYVVAHSMGGLVVRSYIEEKAYSYDVNGNQTSTITFDNDIDRVLFLGTPQHGSFGGNRLYWEIYLTEGTQEFFSDKDSYAPAYRELDMGSKSLSDLNDTPFDNHNVRYFQVSGTTWNGLVPFHITVESEHHEDGIVAISSGNLLGFGVPLALIKNFSHAHLNSPDNDERELSYEEKQYIPSLIDEFFETGTILNYNTVPVAVYLNEVDESKLTGWDNGDDVMLNIALPFVSFIREDGTFWKPEDYPCNTILPNKGFRFRLYTSQNNNEKQAILVKNEISELTNAYEDPGLYLYYGYNNFSESEFKEGLDYDTHYFYGFENNSGTMIKNPLDFNHSSSFIESDNVGWVVPEDQGKDLSLPVYLGYKADLPWQIDPWMIYKIPNATLNLKWSQATYHTFRLNQAAENILESNQYAEGSENWSGPSKTLRKTAADSLIVWLDQDMNNASFLLNYGSNSEPNLELERPDGTVISPADTNGTDIFYVSYPEFGIKYFSLNHPQTGKWKIRINGDYFLPDTSYKLIYPMSVNNWLVLDADTSRIAPGKQTLLTAQLYDRSMSVSDVTLECYYYNNKGQRVNINMNDNGQNGDVIAGDKIYSAYFSSGQDYGFHRINAIMRGVVDENRFYRQGTVEILSATQGPRLAYPLNGVTDMDTASVSLIWYADTLQEQYEVMVAADSQFTTLTYYGTGIKDTVYAISNLTPDESYYWRVRGYGKYGFSEWSPVRSFHTKRPTGIVYAPEAPSSFNLRQNYPNPFNPATTIDYELPRSVHVKLELFNVLGEKVKTLVNARQAAGRYKVHLNLSGLASGVYYYRLKTKDVTRVKRMILMK